MEVASMDWIDVVTTGSGGVQAVTLIVAVHWMVSLLAANTVVLGSLVMGIALLAAGILLGMRMDRRKLQQGGEILSQADREQMVALLEQLGTWTNEYSGNVSEYQSQLGELDKSVRANVSGSGPTASENRVLLLLQQIMKSNDELTDRLDAAERQLDKQTKQIECYLTEARTDGLTGLFNRRAFDKRFEELFTAYRGGGRSFVVALVDIDKFKTINDSYGHQAGDQVLQQMAALMRSQLKNTIMVARFGGEEFVVILEGPLRVAAKQMNDVRRAVAAEKMDAGSVSLDVSISVGVSEPREDLVAAPVVRRADEALYAAKNTGRNRVYIHDGKSTSLVGAPEIAKS